MGLRQDIRSLLSGISRKPGFVSLESLEECMTEQKVKEHVSSIGIPISPGVLEAIFSRPRLFAILVLLENEKAMVPLIADIEDDTFFYLTGKEIPSKIGDIDQRMDFLRLQSQIPPKLSCKDPPQEFPEYFRPPFIYESEKGPSGSYGIVRKVKVAGGHLAGYSSSDWMAWKRIETRHLQVGFLQEVKTLKARPHKHLISLVACYSTPAGQSFQSQDPALHLIFPWADMDMSDWMRPHNAQPPHHLRGPEEPQRRKEYLYETIMSLISAVTYLHCEINGTFTSHHDLKPQNILLFGEQWRICDFGMTRLRSLDEGSQTERKLGTYAYHPPEYADNSVKKHGRSFDIWSMGCIIVELAVLIVYGWESKRLAAFEEERDKNRDRLVQNDSRDVSFHNNMPVVRRWMETMAREDGSRNFMYLMEITAKMLFMDRDFRPYSWEVEIYLYEQFHPDALGHERRTRMRDRIQAPTKTSSHNPLVGAIAEKNSDFVQCLEEKEWTLRSFSGTGRHTTHSKNTSEDTVDLFEDFELSDTQIVKLFKRACDDQGYDLDKIPDKRRDILANRFAARTNFSPRTFWKIKHILEPRHPIDPMKIFTEETYVDQADGNQNTALFRASLGRDTIMVHTLLRYGAHLDPVNKLSETPLMVASKLGHDGVVQRLLQEPRIEVNYRDADKRTSLSYAAQFGRTKAVRLVLESEADPHIAGFRGRTPLSLAAGSGHLEIVNLLMAYEANPLTTDKKGISPLTHTMAEYQHRQWKGEAEVHLRDYPGIIRLLKEKDHVNDNAVKEVFRQRNLDDPH